MTDAFLKLMNLSVTASYLIVGVLSLRLVLRKVPKTLTLWLWTLVGLRLSIPFPLESAFSLIPKGNPIPADIALSPAPAIDSGIPVIDKAVNPVIAQSFTPDPLVSANPLQLLLPVLGLVWLLGIGVMLAYALVSYLRLRKRVSASLRLRDNICLCDHIPTPFLLGLVKPRIYLPSDMAPELQTHVLRHEYAHLRHHDNWWKILGFLLLSVYWFHPLVWVSYLLFCRDLEMACDERAVSDLSEEDRKAYSCALLACAAPKHSLTVCPVAFGEGSVKHRIRNVLMLHKTARWVIALVLMLAGITAICFFTVPKENHWTFPPDSENPPATAQAAVVLDRGTGEIVYSYQPNQQIYSRIACHLALALTVLQDHGPEELVDTRDLNLIYRLPDTDIYYMITPSAEDMETMPVKTLLALPLTATGTHYDAICALARFDAGSEEAMVEKMNSFVSSICPNTHFTDLYGFTDGQYTTAQDLLTLVDLALKDPVISKLWEVAILLLDPDLQEDSLYPTRNYMMDTTVTTAFYDPRVTGGFASINDLVITAKEDGQELICILLGAERRMDEEISYIVTYYGNFEEMGTLLNTVFDA